VIFGHLFILNHYLGLKCGLIQAERDLLQVSQCLDACFQMFQFSICYSFTAIHFKTNLTQFIDLLKSTESSFKLVNFLKVEVNCGSHASFIGLFVSVNLILFITRTKTQVKLIYRRAYHLIESFSACLWDLRSKAAFFRVF